MFAITGLVSEARAHSLETYVKMIEEEDRDKAVYDLKAAVGKGGPFTREFRIRRNDGAVMWLSISGVVEHTETGKPLRAYGTLQDITDRKAHEEQIYLLMREVNHRAKSMLSLVQAIARQTATREPEDFIGCFAERIRALAASQDLLIRNQRGVISRDASRCAMTLRRDANAKTCQTGGPRYLSVAQVCRQRIRPANLRATYSARAAGPAAF